MKNLTVKGGGMADLMKAIDKLRKSEVLIGIPDENADRQPDPHDPHPITNAGIGFVMEHGDPERNIPARPFLGPGVESIEDEIVRRMSEGARKAVTGDLAAVDKALHGVGLAAAAAVKRKIDEGPFEPLAPATLAARKARGRTGEKPLIDTAQLQRAVTYVVRPAKNQGG